MTTAAYYRDWRAAHPEYRERQNALRKARRAVQSRDRRSEYAQRPSRAIVPLPAPFLGHPLFDAARAIVGMDRGTLTMLHDPLREDLLSEAVVALVEGRDPSEAVRRFRAIENGWRAWTCELRVAA